MARLSADDHALAATAARRLELYRRAGWLVGLANVCLAADMAYLFIRPSPTLGLHFIASLVANLTAVVAWFWIGGRRRFAEFQVTHFKEKETLDEHHTPSLP